MTKGLGRWLHNRGRGRAGEEAAAAWLEEQGYRILERNFTTRAGEIDLVAMDAEVLCFVEVKARTGRRHGSPLAAVDSRKQARLARVAALYLARSEGEPPACRFDVLGLEREAERWRFTLVKDAFQTG